MKRRTSIYYTPEQKAIIWDRYKQGDSLHDISRMFDRFHSSILGGVVTLVERHSRFGMLTKISDNKAITVISTLIKQARKLPVEFYKTISVLHPSVELTVRSGQVKWTKGPL
ncbi:hypothetical protein PEC730217_22490 [Pectobacterium carotovorum subsp. carotovorum]|nr:hypothetical protein PEC730217_22490 [Pectobacterium carotovorum subsp. carotovorum]